VPTSKGRGRGKRGKGWRRERERKWRSGGGEERVGREGECASLA